MRPKCSVSGQSNAQYPFQFTFISLFNIIFTITGTLNALRVIHYTYGILLTTVICYAKYFMRLLQFPLKFSTKVSIYLWPEYRLYRRLTSHIFVCPLAKVPVRA